MNTASPRASSYTHPPFREILERLPLKRMLEIGSMHGLDAIEALETYGLERVISVEPNPECVAHCRRNFIGYPQIELVEVAAWSEDTTIPFFPVEASFHADGSPSHTEYRCNIGASSCFRANGAWPIERYVQKEIQVPARRLDGILAERGIDTIDLICMDVQGAALHVLKGLGRRLGTVQAIVTELECRPIYDGQSVFDDIHPFLERWGFGLAACNLWSKLAGDFLYIRVRPAAAP